MRILKRVNLFCVVALMACSGCAGRDHRQATTTSGYTPPDSDSGGFLQGIMQNFATDSANGWDFHKNGW